MITYDHRESKSPVPKALEDLGLDLEKATLNVGDYNIEGENFTLVVERKTATDYINSMQGEHLNNQLYEMSTNFDYSILLIEGYLTGAMFERKVSRQQVIANLASTILKRSPDGEQGVISVVVLDGPYDTALILKYLHDRITGEKPMVRFPRIPAVKWKIEDRALAVLSGFPNIREVRARRILNHPKLNTLAKVVTADIKTLMEVEGIGKTIAAGIVELSTEEYRRTKE